jgi:hypothetical protein
MIYYFGFGFIITFILFLIADIQNGLFSKIDTFYNGFLLLIVFLICWALWPIQLARIISYNIGKGD